MIKISHKLNGKCKQFFLSIINFFEKPAVATVVAIIFYAIPALLILYYTEDNANKLMAGVLSDDLNKLLKEHPTIIFIISLGLLASYHHTPKLVRSLRSGGKTLELEDALTLMEVFRGIVRFKSERFASECSRLLSETLPSPEPAEIFSSITKPDQQMYYIVQSIWAFLDQITKDIEFEVRLIELDQEEKPWEWYIHIPDTKPPLFPVSRLDRPDSTISHCIRTKKTVVVSNIQAEAKAVDRRYAILENNDSGSIICYPLYHKATKSYPYILSIKASKPGYFIEGREDYYKWLLDQFALRIELEHNLRVLKGE